MATNRTATDAINYAKRFVGNMPVDDATIIYRILNDASDRVHLFANWSWSVAFLESEDIVSGTIDYTYTDPTDLLYIVHAALVNGNVNPATEEDLTIVSHLSSDTSIEGTPTQLSYLTSTTYRLQPVPQYTAGEEPKILTWYKLQNTNITSGNVGTASTLLFPDEWFWVYQQLVLLDAMIFTHDPRAGSVTVNNNQIQFSGQWGVVQGSLQAMHQKEKPFLIGLAETVQ